MNTTPIENMSSEEKLAEIKNIVSANLYSIFTGMVIHGAVLRASNSDLGMAGDRSGKLADYTRLKELFNIDGGIPTDAAQQFDANLSEYPELFKVVFNDAIRLLTKWASSPENCKDAERYSYGLYFLAVLLTGSPLTQKTPNPYEVEEFVKFMEGFGYWGE